MAATDYNGTIHDYVILNSKDVPSTWAALKQASDAIRDVLKP